MAEFESDYMGRVGAQIYIGLGGVGGRAVQRMYRRLHADTEWARYKAPCTGFMVVDTNRLDLNDYSKERDLVGVHTARTDRADILQQRMESQDHFLEHFVPKGYRPRTSSEGAGQIRLESRVGFYLYSDVIEQKIKRLFDGIIRPNNVALQASKEIDVFVFCSLAGGTGSGCFLPMALLARHALSDRGWRIRIHGHLMTSDSLTHKVRPELHDFIYANAYAGLKELEHLNRCQVLGKPEEFVFRKPSYASEEVPRVTERPFDTVFIVDEPSGRDLDEDTVGAAMADTAYINLMTPAGSRASSQGDNYTRFLGNLCGISELDSGEVVTRGGFTKGYATHGSAVLVCPTGAIIDYCSTRFVSDLLKEQLASVDPTQNRAMKDPAKWAMLSNEGQDKALNKSWVDAIVDGAREEVKLYEEAEVDDKGYLTRIVERVSPARLGNTTAKVHVGIDEGDSNTEGDVESTEDLVAELKAKLDAQLDAVDKPSLTVRLTADDGTNLLSKLGELEAKAGAQRTRINAAEERLAVLGKELKALRDLKLDATTERFLILELLDGPLDAWLKEAERQTDRRERSLHGSSDVRSKLTEIEKEAHDMESRGTIRDFFGELTGDGKQGNLAEIVKSALVHLRPLVSATNATDEGQLKGALYKAFREACTERSRNYVKVSKSALIRVGELDRQAERLLTKELEGIGSDNYAQGTEVLDSLDKRGKTRRRLWDMYWEDSIKAKLSSIAGDRKRLGEVINQAFVSEEKRSAEQNITVDERRILSTIESAFMQEARQRLTSVVKDEKEGLNFADALELEAIYSLVTQDKSGRAEEVATVRRILADNTDPDHQDKHDKVGQYMTKKLAFVVSKAEVLGQINLAKIKERHDVKPQMKTILVAHPQVLKDLQNRFEAVKKVLEDPGGSGQIQNAAGHGVQEGIDRQSLMVYQVRAFLPPFVFNLRKFHDLYTKVMGLKNKPNPIYSDGRWETGLLDLEENAVRTGKTWRLLSEALGKGVVCLDGAEWVLRIGDNQRTLCDDLERLNETFESQIVELNLHDELTAELSRCSDDAERRQALVKDFEDQLLKQKFSDQKDSALMLDLERLVKSLKS